MRGQGSSIEIMNPTRLIAAMILYLTHNRTMLKSIYELPNGCYHSMEQNDYYLLAQYQASFHHYIGNSSVTETAGTSSIVQ